VVFALPAVTPSFGPSLAGLLPLNKS
jgi:hypothetical protein